MIFFFIIFMYSLRVRAGSTDRAGTVTTEGTRDTKALWWMRAVCGSKGWGPQVKKVQCAQEEWDPCSQGF